MLLNPLLLCSLTGLFRDWRRLRSSRLCVVDFLPDACSDYCVLPLVNLFLHRLCCVGRLYTLLGSRFRGDRRNLYTLMFVTCSMLCLFCYPVCVPRSC